jgi:hypothetical protein
MKKIFIILSLFALTNCQNVPKMMETWMGHDKTKLIMSWGPPDSTFAFSEKITIYSWDGIMSNAYGQSGKVCDMNFYINNETNVIVNYQTGCGIQPIM